MKCDRDKFRVASLMILSVLLAIFYGCKSVPHPKPLPSSAPTPPVRVLTSRSLIRTNHPPNTNWVTLYTNRPIMLHPLEPTNKFWVHWAVHCSTNFGATWFPVDILAFEPRYDWVTYTSNKTTGVVTATTNGTWTNNFVIAAQGPQAWYRIAFQ